MLLPTTDHRPLTTASRLWRALCAVELATLLAAFAADFGRCGIAVVLVQRIGRLICARRPIKGAAARVVAFELFLLLARFALLAAQPTKRLQLLRREHLSDFQLSLRIQFNDRALRRRHFARAFADQILIRVLGVDGLIECAPRLDETQPRCL